MVETLYRRSSMTSEGVWMVADPSIGPHDIRTEPDHGFFAWPVNEVVHPTGTMSWSGWGGLPAGLFDEPGLIGSIENQEWRHQLTPIVRLLSPTVEMNRVKVLKTFISQRLDSADSTIILGASGRDTIGAGISRWMDAEISYLASRVYGASVEFKIADDVTWSIVPAGDDPVDQVGAKFDIAPTELTDALTDLEEIVEEAEEKGFTVPTKSASQLAEQLLYAMYAISPRRFEIYPMPHGEIAIDARDGQGRRIIVFCEPGGSMRCLSNDNGKRDRYSESNPQGTAGPFIREALEAFR